MIYVKSVLAGVAAFVVAAILYVCVVFIFWIRPTLPKTPPGTTVGIDIRLFFVGPYVWLVTLAATAMAFYWEFRRASR